MTTIAWEDLTPLGQKEAIAHLERKRQEAWEAADVSKARVYYADSVSEFEQIKWPTPCGWAWAREFVVRSGEPATRGPSTHGT